LAEEARAALAALRAQPAPDEQAAGQWEGGEEWERLAWHLCAEENGEDACTELIWEGGPQPEPWGDRWLKYEGEAKRLIRLVRAFATHPPAQRAQAEAVAEIVGDTRFEGWLSCHEPDRTCGRTVAYTKQDMRDCYWAGYRERDSLATPQQAAGQAVRHHHGLTEGERDQAVADICAYGTGFVTPLYAVVEGIERKVAERYRLAPQQAAGQAAGRFVNVAGDGHAPDWRQVAPQHANDPDVVTLYFGTAGQPQRGAGEGLVPLTNAQVLPLMKEAGLEKRVDMASLYRFASLVQSAVGIRPAGSEGASNG
jgi:hypothetical protein